MLKQWRSLRRRWHGHAGETPHGQYHRRRMQQFLRIHACRIWNPFQNLPGQMPSAIAQMGSFRLTAFNLLMDRFSAYFIQRPFCLKPGRKRSYLCVRPDMLHRITPPKLIAAKRNTIEGGGG